MNEYRLDLIVDGEKVHSFGRIEAKGARKAIESMMYEQGNYLYHNCYHWHITDDRNEPVYLRMSFENVGHDGAVRSYVRRWTCPFFREVGHIHRFDEVDDLHHVLEGDQLVWKTVGLFDGEVKELYESYSWAVHCAGIGQAVRHDWVIRWHEGRT